MESMQSTSCKMTGWINHKLESTLLGEMLRTSDIDDSDGLVFPSLLDCVIHTVKGFGIVNKAEIDVFLELFCFFDDPVDVGNLISGSSAFSKTSLNIRKFMVHILLKPGLVNFEHYFTSV